MGGRIWVESTPGQGSSFHFTATFKRSNVGDLVKAPEPRLLDLPVLIVDDNPVNRRILLGQLHRWQVRPTAVDSGEAALVALNAAAAAGTPFALVLLDANMPGLDGFGVMRTDRRQSPAGRIHRHDAELVRSSTATSNRCRALNISAYLTKPIEAADLHAAIVRTIRGVATPATSRDSRTPTPALVTRRLKILLAEDNLVNQRVAVGLLSKRGHDVTVANNGLEALAALTGATFDLVLMDVQMPEMGGFEATAEIRRRERESGGHLPIIAMTAHAMAEDCDRCLAAGMDGYLSKPITPNVLFAMVEQHSAPASKVKSVVLPSTTVSDGDLMLKQ